MKAFFPIARNTFSTLRPLFFCEDPFYLIMSLETHFLFSSQTGLSQQMFFFFMAVS